MQGPRAGNTTNIYSTVASGDVRNKVTATSTGAATPITQKLTLNEPGVVDVEFGTNGTSGYNARLALVYVQSAARDLGFQGALTADSDLPTTVMVDGKSVSVMWAEDSATVPRTDYKPMVLKGTIGGGSTAQSVVAHFEVVPAQLLYYIDSGTDGVDSPQYSAVKAATPALANDKVDQVSTSADQWGYVADGMKLKSGTDLADKYSTGLYQDTTQLIYRLPLKAGTYKLTAGFTEWWGMVRTLNHTASVTGTELAKGNIALSGTSTPLASDLTFTLDQPATVEYRVSNEGAGGEKPVISWLAVESVTDKSVLQAAVDAASALQAAEYTTASWAPFAETLASARGVLADDAAVQDTVDAAAENLSAAQALLVKALPVRLAAEQSCAGPNVKVKVTVVNDSELRVTVVLKTPFGTKTFKNLDPGATAFHPFNAQSRSIDAGTVDAEVTATVEGKSVTQHQGLEYPSHSC